MFASLAEFERNLIRERTRAGLDAARRGGEWGVANRNWMPDRFTRYATLLRDPQVNVADVARRYGVSRTTNYKHVGVVVPTRVTRMTPRRERIYDS